MSVVPPLPDDQLLREEMIRPFGLGLKLRIWGDPHKPLVLLQHGGKDHGRSWDWTVEALRTDYCLAVPDLRGHGDSENPLGGGYDTVDMVADMAAIVEHLEAQGQTMPIHVVGHSWGGNLALNFAAALPNRVRSVVSIEGLGFSQDRYDQLVNKPMAARMGEAVQRRLTVAKRKPRVFETQEEGMKRLVALHPQLAQEQAEHLARHALRPCSEGWAWKHDPAMGFMPVRPSPPSEYGQVYREIRAPVLLMYGRDSWATSPKDDGRMDMFTNAELIEFENAGHWLHHDQFTDFIGALRRFLERH
ncbi:MAG: alpha/beta hydrolase [Pseudomonadota bacterium]